MITVMVWDRLVAEMQPTILALQLTHEPLHAAELASTSPQ
jgi:hypothetical protein